LCIKSKEVLDIENYEQAWQRKQLFEQMFQVDSSANAWQMMLKSLPIKTEKMLNDLIRKLDRNG